MQLAGTPQAHFLALLELFAYGSYADYIAGRAAAPPKFPELSAPALQKLRMLTVASLAAEASQLRFETLKEALGLQGAAGSEATAAGASSAAAAPADGGSSASPSDKAVEELLLAALNAGLIAGRINQRRGELEVTGAAVRDVQPSAEALDALLAKVRGWKAAVDAAARDATEQLHAIGAQRAEEASHAAALALQLEDCRREAERELERQHERQGAKGSGGGAGGGHRGAAGVGGMGGMGALMLGGELPDDDTDDEGHGRGCVHSC